MKTIALAYLLLARIVVGEAGWNATEDDIMAHHSVLTSRTERVGWTYVQAAKRYSKKHTGVKYNPRRPWIAELNRSMRKPPNFTKFYRKDKTEITDIVWRSTYKPKWKRILGLAKKAHLGELEQKCIVDHWGSPNHPIDKARIKRAVRSGKQSIIDCGNTKNVFLRINDGFHSDKLQELERVNECVSDGDDCAEETERLNS